MNIGEVLSRTWQIVWRHKVLWIFGILASCSGGGRGGNNLSYQFSGEELPGQVQPFFEQFENFIEGRVALIAIIAVLVILFLVALVILLGTIGRIGLIRGTLQAERGAERLSFGDLFSGSLSYFWRVLGISLLLGLIGIVIAVVSIPLIVFTCGVGFLFLIFVFALLEILQEQTNNAIVVDNLSAMDGLRRGWELVRANLGTLLVMGLILVVGIGFIGSLVLAAPILLVLVPAAVSVGVGAAEGSRALLGGGILFSLLCLVAYTPVLIVLAGMLRAYIGSAWTLTYLRLVQR